MKKLLFILFIVPLLLFACSTPPEAPIDTSTPITEEPQPIAEEPYQFSEDDLELLIEWEGATNKTTEPFTINQTPWVIGWGFNPNEPLFDTYANLFQIRASKVEDEFYFEYAANIANVESHLIETTYMYDTGTFYLEITSLEGQWVIGVFALP